MFLTMMLIRTKSVQSLLIAVVDQTDKYFPGYIGAEDNKREDIKKDVCDRRKYQQYEYLRNQTW